MKNDYSDFVEARIKTKRNERDEKVIKPVYSARTRRPGKQRAAGRPVAMR